MPQRGREIVTGRIVGPFGIRGEVKVIPTTDFPDRFEVGTEVTLSLEGGHKTFRIQRSRFHRSGFLLKLEGIDTRDAAEQLRGVDIVIDESELRDLGPDRYYIFEIVGLRVVTEDGREQGIITEVLQGGANDVYVTSTGLCIPALKTVVVRVDLEHQLMTIRPMPGMLVE